ncbi:MAG: response regulator [Candidatus Nitrosocosmicus sp.]
MNTAKNHGILVVDDYGDISYLVKTLLQKYGFDVYEFNDPLLALDYFKENAKKFALIITDVMMPGMSGIELLVKIKEISPDVKSFLMTSFEINAIKTEIVKNALEISEIIQKPIPLKELVMSVNKHIKLNVI